MVKIRTTAENENKKLKKALQTVNNNNNQNLTTGGSDHIVQTAS